MEANFQASWPPETRAFMVSSGSTVNLVIAASGTNAMKTAMAPQVTTVRVTSRLR